MSEASAESPQPAWVAADGWPEETAARVSDAWGTPCVDVEPAAWLAAVTHARDALGADLFDWLSAVDEPQAEPPAVDVVLHLVATAPVRRLMLRTRLPGAEPRLDSVTGLFAGAAWHERETHEMFGVGFDGFDDGSGAGLRPLLLPDGFEGTPLRKSFVLASRAAKAWPGAKEPGEPDAERSPSRRSMLPPGVPDPATWGPRDPDDGTGDDGTGDDGTGDDGTGDDRA